MKAIGNAIQTADSLGLVKALLNVNPYGAVYQCYNGVTRQQTGTGDCGFTVAKTKSQCTQTTPATTDPEVDADFSIAVF